MKKFFICLATSIAFLACNLSCKQYDNPDNQTDAANAIAAALKGARCQVMEADGTVVSESIAVGAGNGVSIIIFIGIISRMESNTPLFIKDDNGELQEISNVEIFGGRGDKPICIGYALSARLPRSLTPLSLGNSGGQSNDAGLHATEWMVDIADIVGGVTCPAIVHFKDIENNLKAHADKCFLHMGMIQDKPYAISLDQVKTNVADGNEDLSISLVAAPILGFLGIPATL